MRRSTRSRHRKRTTRIFAHCVLIIAAVATQACLLSPQEDPPPPPHPGTSTNHSVVMVTIDTWRADHFNARYTPNLWEAAQTGTRIKTAWTPIGLTSPALATMFTGLMPWEHGLRANNHHGYRLHTHLETTAESAKERGKKTAAFVSAYPAGPNGGLDEGFDIFDGPESGERSGAIAVKRARTWLAEQGKDAPIYLWVHLYEPHGPYEPEEKHLKALGFSPSKATDVERYAAEVYGADALLAPLLDDISARTGTALVIAGDHGEVLLEETCGRQHERSTHEVVLHVPLVFRGAGMSSKTFEKPVSVSVVHQVVETWLRGAVPELEALTAANEPMPAFLAESGICEPDCAPGCAPEGLMGRDRLVHSEAWRIFDRPGRGKWSEGIDAPSDEHWRAYLDRIPPMSAPALSPEQSEARSLGYTE